MVSRFSDFDDTTLAVSTPTAPGGRCPKRAAELFDIDEWGSDSGFVEKAWRSHSEPEPAFISIAASHWQIVLTTKRNLTQVTVRGPETRATLTAIPAWRSAILAHLR